MNSSIITPVRIYTDIYESDRFSTACDICRFELISDKTRLLPFQFRRPKSPYLIDKWFLRNQCENPTQELLSNNDSLFTIDTGYWTKSHFAFVSGKVKGTGGSASNFRKLGILTIGKYYDITIVVNEFVKATASTFAVTYDIGGSGVTAITQTGTISFKILASTTDFTIDGSGGTSSDYITIESIKINEYKSFSTGIGDIELDKTLLSLVNINTEEDLIQYCGDNLPKQIPCGKYYMVISMLDNSVYYSELITVKDFIPSRSPYTLIEWTNTCDLSDVIYQEIDGCSFKNRMYIDSELLKPEYPFKEEGEEDGNYKINILFQKWEKKQSLLVAKCPEFIVDALTAMRLHDTITITKSLRKQQLQVLAPIDVESIEYVNASVFSDCATNVELVLLLKDKVVDAACCTNTALSTCFECTYTVDDIDVLTGNYYFGTPTEELDFGLYELVGEAYVLIANENDVVCVTETGLKYINLNAEYWTAVPFIQNVVDTDLGSGNHSYVITGYIYPDSYARIRVVIYDADLTTTTTINYTEIYEQADLTTGVTILSSTFGGVDVPVNGSVSFFIENFTLTCTYGYSQAFDTFYPDLHAVVIAWRNTLIIKPSVQTILAFNVFIEGLEADGILSEFDLLHVIAGLDTTEQRLTPLITSSSNDFQTSGTFTFNSSGFKGNGADGFIDLAWSAATNGVKYLQDDASMGVYINDNVQEDTYDIGTKDGTVNAGIRSRTLLNTAIATLNNDVIVNTPSPSSVGMFSVSFDGTTRIIYKNGVSANTSVSASTGLSNYVQYLGARNNEGTSDGFTTRTYQMIFIGSASIDQTFLYNRFNTLKAALGF